MHAKICLIILNYISFEDTIVYVKSVLNQERVDLHVLIVDNKSPNESYVKLLNTFIKNSKVRVIESGKNGGYAYGNNFGLKFIEDEGFDYIVISNNDVDINDQRLLYKLIDEYKSLDSPAFIAPMVNNNGCETNNSAWKIPLLLDDLLGSLRLLKFFSNKRIQYNFYDNEVYKVDCLSGAFFLAKKNVFYDVGLFDEMTFLYCEERILAYKVKELKLCNYLVRSLCVEHHVSKTISSQLTIFKMMSYLTESQVYFHRKYAKSNEVGIYLLKVMSKLRVVESFILNVARGCFAKKNL